MMVPLRRYLVVVPRAGRDLGAVVLDAEDQAAGAVFLVPVVDVDLVSGPAGISFPRGPDEDPLSASSLSILKSSSRTKSAKGALCRSQKKPPAASLRTPGAAVHWAFTAGSQPKVDSPSQRRIHPLAISASDSVVGCGCWARSAGNKRTNSMITRAGLLDMASPHATPIPAPRGSATGSCREFAAQPPRSYSQRPSAQKRLSRVNPNEAAEGRGFSRCSSSGATTNWSGCQS